MSTTPGARQRMLDSALALLRERGAAGVTVDAVLQRSQAPRGSVYYHFPDGRGQILSEAVAIAGDAIGGILESGTEVGSVRALRRFRNLWAAILDQSSFDASCPAVSVAVGGSRDDETLQPAVTEIFDRWHRAMVEAIAAEGVPADRARRLATLALSAIEGAIILCRVKKSIQPLDDALAELEIMIDSVRTA